MAKNRDVRGTRDQAGVGPDSRQVRHLRPISEMKKIKIASGEPDVRGWSVFTSSGRDVGSVKDLLVDPTIGQVVMLDLDIEGSDRRSLAPIRAAWIDRDHKRVVLDAAQIRDDEIMPSMARGRTDDDEVTRFDDGYRRAYGDRGFDSDTDWDVRHADDDLRFGRRRADRDRDNDGVNDSVEYRIERRRAEAAERERHEREEAERERQERERESEMREVRYHEEALRADRPVVVEEHVVRRRVVDPDQIDDASR
jgi:sporulation protein YlmC with PRC-barrel domain